MACSGPAPIDCVTDSELDRFLGSDPTPDDPAEEQNFAQTSRDFAQGCSRNAAPLLAHVSTEEAARDMDILRAALGEKKLTYLGKSYGTYLGAIYADLFPDNVGRMVLDGVVPPDLTASRWQPGPGQGLRACHPAVGRLLRRKRGLPPRQLRRRR